MNKYHILTTQHRYHSTIGMARVWPDELAHRFAKKARGRPGH